MASDRLPVTVSSYGPMAAVALQADGCMRISSDALRADVYRSSADLRRAELLLEWALRLEQINRTEEAATLFTTSVNLLEFRADRGVDGALGPALLAVGPALLAVGYAAKRGGRDQMAA